MIVCTEKDLRYLDFFAQVSSFSDLAVLLHVCLTLSFICKHQIVGLVDLQLLIAPKPVCVALLGLIPVAVSEHRHVPLRRDARIEQLIRHHLVHLLNRIGATGLDISHLFLLPIARGISLKVLV